MWQDDSSTEKDTLLQWGSEIGSIFLQQISQGGRVAGPLFMIKMEHNPCHRSLISICHMLKPQMVLKLGRKPFSKHWICNRKTLSSKEGGWILAPKFTAVVTLGKFLDSLSSTIIVKASFWTSKVRLGCATSFSYLSCFHLLAETGRRGSKHVKKALLLWLPSLFISVHTICPPMPQLYLTDWPLF